MSRLLNSLKPANGTSINSISKKVEEVTSEFSDLPHDILQAHILPHLDGPSLASTTCCSTTLSHISSQYHLWSQLCHATWPSTTAASFNEVISTFTNYGPYTFFAQAYPLPVLNLTISESSDQNNLLPPPKGLISAVDIRYKDELIFSKIQETETVSNWFRCMPFRIDLLEPKDVIPSSRIIQLESEETCSDVATNMTLSWIILDPKGRRAVNLSSYKPVSVERHWLSREIHSRFSTILAGTAKNSIVQCGIVVTCGRSDEWGMQLREVSFQLEDMDGTHLNGKDILVILQKALESKRGNAFNRENEGRKMYIHYLEMKQERSERKQRVEETLNSLLCVFFETCCFLAFCVFFWCQT